MELTRFVKGTGLSSTVTARSLAIEGGPAEQASLLKNLRADSIGMSIHGILVGLQDMANEDCFSHGLRGNPQDFDEGLSGGEEKMDDHGY